MPKVLSRRRLIHLAGVASGAAALSARTGGVEAQASADRAATTAEHPAVFEHSRHALGTVGRVSTEAFHPGRYLRSWNFSDLAPADQARYYRETPQPDGTLLREYEIFAVDREIEIAPGVYFPAWTYNGQVPGPTLRVTEGDRVLIRFLNQGSHPHTLHFHGWHAPEMDGSLPAHQVMPGETFVYDFVADPFGLHLYHCHALPLKRHIHKGLYGVFIVDPRTSRPPADELVMMMNAFDTNFDADNEVYAVNTAAFFHMAEPIRVELGRLVRIYLVNVTEFDLVNSFHLHGMFFKVYRTGTSLETSEVSDTLMLCQGERAILETTFRYPGQFMFHAHQSEFAELGWMGLFEAGAQSNAS